MLDADLTDQRPVEVQYQPPICPSHVFREFARPYLILINRQFSLNQRKVFLAFQFDDSLALFSLNGDDFEVFSIRDGLKKSRQQKKGEQVGYQMFSIHISMIIH